MLLLKKLFLLSFDQREGKQSGLAEDKCETGRRKLKECKGPKEKEVHRQTPAQIDRELGKFWSQSIPAPRAHVRKHACAGAGGESDPSLQHCNIYELRELVCSISDI